jgi:carboxymethylenebutenolidase
MMLYPGEDNLVPRVSFDELQTALQGRAQGSTIVHLYPQAEHGFSARNRQENNEINATAYAVSWPQALAFIQATTRAS